MERLFRRAGFRVTGIDREYGRQYLCLHAQPALSLDQSPAPPEHSEIDAVRSFVTRVDELRGRWTGCLQRWHREGRRVAIWGSGSKSLAFLTTLRATECVEALIDINPVRQDSWQPGTGLPIRAPESLSAQPPDVVVVMNRLYWLEISAMLDALSLRPRVVALGDDPAIVAGA